MPRPKRAGINVRHVSYPSGTEKNFENQVNSISLTSEETSGKEKRADTLGAHLAGPWTHGQQVPRKLREVRKIMVDEKWPHEREGVVIPMPSGGQLAAMRREFYQRAEGEPVGPVTARWRADVFAWAKRLRIKCFGDSKQVTGLWARAKRRFMARLQYLKDKALVRRVLREIEHGASLPFDPVPQAPIRAKSNHKDLAKRAAHVYKALCMQLDEGSVQAFPAKQGLPKGVLSLRWVEKKDPNEVRLTLNGIPLNVFFPKK